MAFNLNGFNFNQSIVDSQGRVINTWADILNRVSVVISSGDSGANGRTDPFCSQQILKPAFPTSSPWVTSVGATQIVNGVALANAPTICADHGPCGATGTEVAVIYDWASFTSGGGFSAFTPRPKYQDAAVRAYLANAKVAKPPASFFNASNRAYPDLAAIGHGFLTISNGNVSPAGGTSLSSPVVAALVALLNRVAIKITKKPLGFLNPLLYKAYAAYPAAFHDITFGDNKCTENGCSSDCQGFVCAAGWDPVTGLGSLNYQAFENYLKKTLKRGGPGRS